MRNDSSRPWRYRAVAFDLDGILIDTEPVFTEAARRYVEKRGIAFDSEFMHAIMGAPAAQTLPRFREHFALPESLEAIAAEYTVHFYEVLGNGPGPLMNGVVGLLDRLGQRKVPCSIVTSSGPDFVAQVFGPHGLLDRFQFVLTCDNVKRGKPCPDVYELAAARFGIDPSDMVVLEDSPNGLRAAKAAGARCIVVPHPLTPLEHLEGADAVVPSLASEELREILGLAI
jgi:HAD superfamily hydrolase (TIGR01509 family)